MDEFVCLESDAQWGFAVTCTCSEENLAPSFCTGMIYYSPCWYQKCKHLAMEPLEGSVVMVPEWEME